MSWTPKMRKKQTPPDLDDVPDRFSPSPWEHLRFEVYKRDGFRCIYCGWSRPQDPKGDPSNRLEIDHIKPRAEGGQDELTNLVTSCKRCNSGKWYINLLEVLPPLDLWLIKRTRVKRRLSKLLREYEAASAELAQIDSPYFQTQARIRRIEKKPYNFD